MTTYSLSSQCLRIPELLIEIASNLPNRDISCLSRCNHLSYEVVMPLLFQNICIPFQRVSSVAHILNANPHFASLCTSLTIQGSDREIKLGSKRYHYQTIFDHLVMLINTLATKSNVKFFAWGLDRNLYMPPVPSIVWQAFGKLSNSLEQLHVVIRADDENWADLCALSYPKLRVLQVWLHGSYEWDYHPLQSMLDDLNQLEYLLLSLPRTLGIELSSIHPRLRTFVLNTDRLDGDAFYFLKRHPAIERLSLEGATGHVLDDADLPRLKALVVDQLAIVDTPMLLVSSARRPITHLRFVDMPYLNGTFTRQLAENVSASLCHLEFVWIINGFRRSIPGFAQFLQVVPRLEELRISVQSANTTPVPRSLCSEDLTNLLSSIQDSTNITRLRLSDTIGDTLPRSFLNDMGVKPPSLLYLSWHVQSHLYTYRLETHDGKTVAKATQPHTGKTILDLDMVNS